MHPPTKFTQAELRMLRDALRDQVDQQWKIYNSLTLDKDRAQQSDYIDEHERLLNKLERYKEENM